MLLKYILRNFICVKYILPLHTTVSQIYLVPSTLVAWWETLYVWNKEQHLREKKWSIYILFINYGTVDIPCCTKHAAMCIICNIYIFISINTLWLEWTTKMKKSSQSSKSVMGEAKSLNSVRYHKFPMGTNISHYCRSRCLMEVKTVSHLWTGFTSNMQHEWLIKL